MVTHLNTETEHHDDLSVDRFAIAMKQKLFKKRAEGRGGWEDPAQCTQYDLSMLLIDHVMKGDPVDIANFAMMLHQRGERVSLEPSACEMVREDSRAKAATLREAISARAALSDTTSKEA